MRERRWGAAVLLAAMALLLLASCGGAAGGTLKVGVKDDTTNFGLYSTESQEYSGMEIDLARLIAEDLGYGGVEFVNVTAATREQMLDRGDVDMVIATFSKTEERLEKYDFSSTYYTDYVGVMVEESSLIDSLRELKGCRVGVMSGSTHALTLAEYMAEQRVIPAFDEDSFTPAGFDGGVTFVEYDTYADISQALEYGEVDAFAADRSILNVYMDGGRVFLPDQFSPQEYGVCTPKGSSLSAGVEKTVQAVLADGTMDELVQKWRN